MSSSSFPELPASTANYSADDFVIQLVLDHGLIKPAHVAQARETLAAHTDLTAPPPRLLDVLVAEAGLDLGIVYVPPPHSPAVLEAHAVVLEPLLG